jgi:hypothetical protein
VGLLLAATLTTPSPLASTGEEQALKSALVFGRALKSGNSGQMRTLLPTSGKVRLRLVAFGPEEGSYSGEQVQALFKDFFRQGKVRSYELVRMDCASEQFTLVQAAAGIVDRAGRQIQVHLHLTFQPEGDRWVLREIRETAP